MEFYEGFGVCHLARPQIAERKTTNIFWLVVNKKSLSLNKWSWTSNDSDDGRVGFCMISVLLKNTTRIRWCHWDVESVARHLSKAISPCLCSTDPIRFSRREAATHQLVISGSKTGVLPCRSCFVRPRLEVYARVNGPASTVDHWVVFWRTHGRPRRRDGREDHSGKFDMHGELCKNGLSFYNLFFLIISLFRPGSNGTRAVGR